MNPPPSIGSRTRCARSIRGVGLVGVLLLASTSAAVAQAERIAQIRVHGNHTTPADDILALSGLSTGDEASPERLREAERVMRDTGRFEAVELRRRYLSLTDPTQILVMIVVDEHPAPVGAQEADEVPEQHRLAAPAPPDDDRDRAGRHLEVEVAEHGVAVEGLPEPFHPDHGRTDPMM